MYITIDNIYSEDFLKWLMKRMFFIGLDYVNSHKEQLKPLDEYLSKSIQGKRKYSALNIIIAGLRNLTITHNKNQSIISINERTKLPLSNKILLYTVCKLINYGSLDLKPFPVFTYVFDYVANNIIKLYNEYELGVVL